MNSGRPRYGQAQHAAQRGAFVSVLPVLAHRVAGSVNVIGYCASVMSERVDTASKRIRATALRTDQAFATVDAMAATERQGRKDICFGFHEGVADRMRLAYNEPQVRPNRQLKTQTKSKCASSESFCTNESNINHDVLERVAGRYPGCYVRVTGSGDCFRPYAGESHGPSHLQQARVPPAQAPVRRLSRIN